MKIQGAPEAAPGSIPTLSTWWYSRKKDAYVAYCPEMDLSSCGGSVDEAKQMLRAAMRLFLEESEKTGGLDEILLESGYSCGSDGL